MKISSEHINNLLAYARERHGAPCRVELSLRHFIGEQLYCEIFYREGDIRQTQIYPVERILI